MIKWFGRQGLVGQAGAALRWSPARFFENGELGTFSDITTYPTSYFTDAGTTPAAIDAPIYQINDQSGNGVNWTQGTLTARPVLSARYNLLRHTQQMHLSPWTNSAGSSVVATSGHTDPYGGLDGVLLSSLTASGGAGSYRQTVHGGPENAPVTVSVSVNVISASGNLRISNPYSGIFGDWVVDVSMLGTGWNRITEDHPAVTVVNPFRFNSTGNGGMQFGTAATSGASIDLLVYGADLRLASDTDQPAYQRVGNPAAVPGDYDTVGFDKYLKFDLGDDSLSTTLPAGTYTVALPTREGIFFDTVTHAGGTFTLGPTTYTGGPAGILTALASGSECRLIGPPLLLNRALTASEQTALVRWYQTRGAGPELERVEIADDDFSDYADQAAAEVAGYSFGAGSSFDAANNAISWDGTTAAVYVGFTGMLGLTDASVLLIELDLANYAAGSIVPQTNAGGAFPSATANGTYRGTLLYEPGYYARIAGFGTASVKLTRLKIEKLQPKGGA